MITIELAKVISDAQKEGKQVTLVTLNPQAWLELESVTARGIVTLRCRGVTVSLAGHQVERIRVWSV